MTKPWKCPIDCTCFTCLAKMAAKDCPACHGEGYVMVGFDRNEIEEPCACTESKRIERAEKAGAFAPSQRRL